MELFDLNFNLKNLLESSSIQDVLVNFSVIFLLDFLMFLYILFIDSKI